MADSQRGSILRLRAGVGRPDDLTGSIAQARAVGEAVDIEVAVREEVESLTEPTPTPPSGTVVGP